MRHPNEPSEKNGEVSVLKYMMHLLKIVMWNDYK